MDDDVVVKLPRQKRRRRLRRVLVVTGAVLALLLCALTIYRIILARKVAAELAKIKAQGYPVTLEELNAWYAEPPPGENAADVYAAAFALYNNIPEPSDLPTTMLYDATQSPDAPLPQETKLRTQKMLADNAEAIDLLHKAASMPHCRFQVDFTKAFQLPLPTLLFTGWNDNPPYKTGIWKGVCLLLEWEALVSADDRNSEQAVSAILTMFGIARHLDDEPLLDAQAFRTAYQSLAVIDLERVLSVTQLSDEQLQQLDEAIEEAEDTSGVIRMAIAQRCIGSAAFHDPVASRNVWNLMVFWATRGARQKGNAIPIALRRFIGATDREHLYFLHAMENYIADVQSRAKTGFMVPFPCPEFIGTGRSFKSAAIQRPILVWFMVAWPLIGGNFSNSTSNMRMAKVAIALERYRNANSSVPEQLDAIVPEYLSSIPADPFDGKPIRYKRLDKGYLLYVVGSDMKDDGGEQNKDDRFAPDMVFRVAR